MPAQPSPHLGDWTDLQAIEEITMNLFRGPGQSGGRRRERLAAGAALMCAAALLGSTLAGGSAHASVIDTVAVYGNSKAEVERWDTAWDLCRAQNINTHSVKIEGPGEKTGPWGPGLPNEWVAYWACYDTTNTTSLP
jgi:hypothetical protein